MVLAMTGSNPQPCSETVAIAIANINSLRGNELIFGVVQEVLIEFLVGDEVAYSWWGDEVAYQRHTALSSWTSICTLCDLELRPLKAQALVAQKHL